METVLRKLHVGDRVRANRLIIQAGFVAKKGSLGRVASEDNLFVGVVWDDNPNHVILPTPRHALDAVGATGQWRHGWWYRYAASELRRPYERGWYVRLPWRRIVDSRRLSAVCFKIAAALDAEGADRIERYPASAKFADDLGVLLDWLEM